MKKILMYKGKSKYNVVRQFTEYMQEAFEQLGHTVIMIDCLNQSHLDNDLQKAINDKIDLVFAFNGIMSELDFDGKNIYNIMNVPYVTMLVDHPLYHHQRIAADIRRFAVTCIDEGHREYLRKYLKPSYELEFLPHGGCCPEHTVAYSDRKYDIVFTGTFHDPKQSYEKITETTGALGEDIAEYWLSHSEQTFQSIVEAVVQEKGLEFNRKEMNFLMWKLLPVEKYIRQSFRANAIRQLINDGVKVCVFGSGWDQFDCNSELLERKGEVSFQEALNIMGNSRIVLDVIGIYNRGAHERVFSSMLAGAVCVTNESTYLSRAFKNGEEVILYSVDDMADMSAKVQDILANPHKGESIAVKGKRAAEDNHTWMHRATKILEIAENL